MAKFDKNIKEMDDFEFLQKVKNQENERLSKLLLKNPKGIEIETIKMFRKIQREHPEMIEVVELENTDELTF
ncbi:MAG: hypothetical protein ACLRFE_03065 [Clostridia bacterium]